VDKLANPIPQILDDYKAAVFAKDVDSFVALYDPQVTAFDMWGVWSYNGIAAWRDMAAHWLGSLGTERVIVDFSDAQSVVGEDVAVVHAFVNYKALSADGVELRSMDNRLTLTLRNQGDGWKIVHQHSSCPVDGEAKVIFRR
jgi:ketosteroid isomerase-like protein